MNNLRGLSQLCDEFHFGALAARLQSFRESDDFKQQMTPEEIDVRTPLPKTEIAHTSALFEGAFAFTNSGKTIECTVGQAVAISPAVRNLISVDACAHTFALRDINAVDSVRCLISGGAVPTGQSLSELGSQLCSPGLEVAEWVGKNRLDLNSTDLSKFSVEALDDVPARGFFSIASEDQLLARLSSLDVEYRPLLRWIEMKFLSAEGLAELVECLMFPTEHVFSGIPMCFLHPPPHRAPSSGPSPWNSIIVSSCPSIFEEFAHKQFLLL
jgi:hypothetical protein